MLNKKGITILEIMLSIIVGSIVLTTLMSLLSMTVNARSTLELENRLENENYFVAKQLSNELFDLQVHSLQLIAETDDYTVIDFTHEYDIIIGSEGAIETDTSNPVTYRLIYYKTSFEIRYGVLTEDNQDYATFDGPLLHDNNISFVEGTKFELGDIDYNECSLASVVSEDPIVFQSCDEGVLVLTLVIAYGDEGETETFITTIII